MRTLLVFSVIAAHRFALWRDAPGLLSHGESVAAMHRGTFDQMSAG